MLKGMADHIQKFWRHCYGADGGGGAVAALVAAAQRTMTALCVTPLLPGAAASAPVSGPWPDALFKGYVHVGRGGFEEGPCCRAAEHNPVSSMTLAVVLLPVLHLALFV